jgi:hypothetical protein
VTASTAFRGIDFASVKVQGPEDFDRFEAGEVLVAQATAPAWTVLFARAAAVVTDGGAVVLPFHILAGLTCVVLGASAALSRKRPGRHPRFGETYFWLLSFVFASAVALAVLRWSQDYHLFFIGGIASACALVGYLARKVHWSNWLYFHVIGMGRRTFLLTPSTSTTDQTFPYGRRLYMSSTGLCRA